MSYLLLDAFSSLRSCPSLAATSSLSPDQLIPWDGCSYHQVMSWRYPCLSNPTWKNMKNESHEMICYCDPPTFSFHQLPRYFTQEWLDWFCHAFESTSWTCPVHGVDATALETLHSVLLHLKGYGGSLVPWESQGGKTPIAKMSSPLGCVDVSWLKV